MSKKRDERELIQRFIIENINDHPSDIVTQVVIKFGLSRQSANRYLQNLVTAGVLSASGSTRKREYTLTPLIEQEFYLDIAHGFDEDRIWRDNLRPYLIDIPKNILDICNYGVTEMLNNVLDHSEGKTGLIILTKTALEIKISIYDDGVGIFNKIQRELHLEDKRHAILELSKGKLTTDPERHTGEGIFFTSRAFDHYSILSSDLFFVHEGPDDDWLLEDHAGEGKTGTFITMKINLNSTRTIKEVFDRHTDKESFDFSRTHVPVKLVSYGDENLVSRSQAKRLLSRFERFKEVFLDFNGVQTIGPAFADEIFRVYWNRNPQIKLIWINANPEVEKAIKRAEIAREGA